MRRTLKNEWLPFILPLSIIVTLANIVLDWLRGLGHAYSYMSSCKEYFILFFCINVVGILISLIRFNKK